MAVVVVVVVVYVHVTTEQTHPPSLTDSTAGRFERFVALPFIKHKNSFKNADELQSELSP